MARFRIKLEKKWGNEHDGALAYIYSDGTKLPLTPLMVKEWARALVCCLFHSSVFIGIDFLFSMTALQH